MSVRRTMYQQALATRQQIYNLALSSGRVTPFIFPWDTLPALYLFLAIFFNPKIPKRYSRVFNVSILILIVGHATYVITHRRSVGMASGYGIGLTMFWGAIMTTTFLLVHNTPQDFVRLEWRDPGVNGRVKGSDEGSVHSQITTSANSTPLRNRQVNGTATKSRSDRERLDSKSAHHLVWQSFPDTFYHRLDWTLDLMTSFRGPNWNFRIPTLPPIDVPPYSDKSIKFTRALKTDNSERPVTIPDIVQSPTYKIRSIRNTIIYYLIIDVIKATVITDAYFLGLLPMSSPSPWRMVRIISNTTHLSLPFLTHLVRLLITLPAVICALGFIFSLCPLFFYTILPFFVDPRRITYASWTDQWLYPSYFAPAFPTIADKGLAGLWGKCWHQMFRYGISEPSNPVLRLLGVNPKSETGRAIQLIIAFGLSGMIHTTAAYTTFSIIPSKPYMPLLFFTSQAFGITIQTLTSNFIRKTLQIEPPKLLSQVTNTVFVVMWGYFTGPWLADDFARCGIWLFEPLPISFVRGMKYGNWWMWEGLSDWVGMWRPEGSPFWEKGIAIY